MATSHIIRLHTLSSRTSQRLAGCMTRVDQPTRISVFILSLFSLSLFIYSSGQLNHQQVANFLFILMPRTLPNEYRREIKRKKKEARQVQKITYQNRAAFIINEDPNDKESRIKILAENQPQVGVSIKTNSSVVLEKMIFKSPYYVPAIKDGYTRSLHEDIKELQPIFVGEDGTRIYR